MYFLFIYNYKNLAVTPKQCDVLRLTKNCLIFITTAQYKGRRVPPLLIRHFNSQNESYSCGLVMSLVSSVFLVFFFYVAFASTLSISYVNASVS